MGPCRWCRRWAFLVHALGDLVGEVAGVELRDGGHDAVQQHPGRGLVDVLRRGDEHDPGLFQGQVDRHVVGAVAGEPVDLVNDAVGDLVGLDVLDHPHQLGPVGLAGGLAGVDELLGDDRVQLAGLAEVRLALGGDREALVPAALGGLLLGGDAQVGDGECGGLADAIEHGGGSAGAVVVMVMGRVSFPGGGATRAAATARAVRLVMGKHDPEQLRRSRPGKPRRPNRTAHHDQPKAQPLASCASTILPRRPDVLEAAGRCGVRRGRGAVLLGAERAMPMNSCASLCRSGVCRGSASIRYVRIRAPAGSSRRGKPMSRDFSGRRSSRLRRTLPRPRGGLRPDRRRTVRSPPRGRR
jgi:hypothetical protein